MRTHPQAQEKSPILNLIAAVAAALALMSLISAQVSAQRQPVTPSPGGEGRIHAKEEGHARTELHAKEEILNEHIPPILIYDGSLTIETEPYPTPTPSGNPNRPYKYKKANGKRIYRVVVTAFTEDGVPYYYPWNFSSGGWQVKVWLQKLKPGSSSVYEDVSTDPDEPQIIIRDSHEIEIDKPTLNPGNLSCQDTDNPIRPRKCQHAPYSPTHFRIKRVEIVKGNQVEYPILPPDSDRDRIIIALYYRQ